MISSPNILLDPRIPVEELIDFTHSEEWAHTSDGKSKEYHCKGRIFHLGLTKKKIMLAFIDLPEKYKVSGMQSIDESIKCDMFSLGIVFWK